MTNSSILTNPRSGPTCSEVRTVLSYSYGSFLVRLCINYFISRRHKVGLMHRATERTYLKYFYWGKFVDTSYFSLHQSSADLCYFLNPEGASPPTAKGRSPLAYSVPSAFPNPLFYGSAAPLWGASCRTRTSMACECAPRCCGARDAGAGAAVERLQHRAFGTVGENRRIRFILSLI